jgi:Holliday junction resolvase
VGVSLRGLRDQFPSTGAPVRRRARVDANHAEVRSALRAAGWTVVDCARIGAGFPDLLIAKHGRIVMVEIKDGAKVKSAQKLTEDEVQFHALMAAAGVTVSVVTSVEEALEL